MEFHNNFIGKIAANDLFIFQIEDCDATYSFILVYLGMHECVFDYRFSVDESGLCQIYDVNYIDNHLFIQLDLKVQINPACALKGRRLHLQVLIQIPVQIFEKIIATLL